VRSWCFFCATRLADSLKGIMPDDVVRFLPNQSCVELSLWSEFSDLKLDKYKLSEEAVPLLAHVNASQYANVPSAVLLDAGSLQCRSDGHAGEHGIPGTLHHKNTFEAFKSSDKAKLLADAGAQVWCDITSGAAEADPALLSRFILLAYGDLKHYHFYYWFAFPALKPPKPFTQSSNSSLAEAEPELGSQLAAACDTWLASGISAAPAWLLYKASDGSFTSAPLSQAQQLLSAGTRLWLAFSDASNESSYPGWLLRNLLLLAALRWRLPSLDVLCVRQTRRATDTQRSRLLQVRCSAVWLHLLQQGHPLLHPSHAAGAVYIGSTWCS
jgi:ubiquitin-like modifier-activating enzyme ATG7